MRSIRNIGDVELPELVAGDFAYFVLDGQQRLTSLFASLKGITIQRENGNEDEYSRMYVDLEAAEDEQIVILKNCRNMTGALTYRKKASQKMDGSVPEEVT